MHPFSQEIILGMSSIQKQGGSVSQWQLRPAYRAFSCFSVPHRTLASKKFLAPLTPSMETSISESFARVNRPLSSSSSPAAALWKISKNQQYREKTLKLFTEAQTKHKQHNSSPTCRGLEFTFLSKGIQVYTNQAVPRTLYPALAHSPVRLKEVGIPQENRVSW